MVVDSGGFKGGGTAAPPFGLEFFSLKPLFPSKMRIIMVIVFKIFQMVELKMIIPGRKEGLAQWRRQL